MMSFDRSISAVVLAAGQSSRMGRAKQLEVVGGEPMVVRAVRTALASQASEVIVVVGAYADAVTAALAEVRASAGNRLRLVTNPLFASGQASSIRTAVSALGGRCGAALFLPVDQPFVPAGLLNRLISAWRNGAHIAAVAVGGELRGAPAIFDQIHFAELLRLEGDVGARPLLRQYQSEIITVAANEAELRDIDTPEALAAANRNSPSGL